MNRLYCSDDTKDVDLEERSAVHFITTEDEDRMGDVVRADGMDSSAFDKNPVVLFGHDYGSLPIGKSLWRKPAVRNGVKGIIAKTQFAPTPAGEQAFVLWKEGFLNATSIGFLPKADKMTLREKGGYDIGGWDLLEYSIVPVPANPQALRLAVEKGLDVSHLPQVREAVLTQRICELEECRAKMPDIKDFGPDILALQAQIKEMQDRLVEIAARSNRDEMMAAARGAVSRYIESNFVTRKGR